ncbi:MAG: hypothetical protein ACKV1O_18880, partial [Saprospiraceae bacterium]
KEGINNQECDILLEKNWIKIINSTKGYWQRGNFLLVEFDGNSRFRFVRGSSNKDWLPLED